MITLVNPRNFPVHVGDDDTGFVIPAYGTRTANIKASAVPNSLVVIPASNSKPASSPTQKSSGPSVGGK